MIDFDSSQWSNYSLLISGYCRHKAFLVHMTNRTFQDFWEELANFYEIPLDGEFLNNFTITSVLLVNRQDGQWLNEQGLLSFILE